jgi:PBP1b-binding outer membrane lipoprotein LpoB
MRILLISLLFLSGCVNCPTNNTYIEASENDFYFQLNGDLEFDG